MHLLPRYLPRALLSAEVAAAAVPARLPGSTLTFQRKGNKGA
jgi:hypothetical protein